MKKYYVIQEGSGVGDYKPYNASNRDPFIPTKDEQLEVCEEELQAYEKKVDELKAEIKEYREALNLSARFLKSRHREQAKSIQELLNKYK